MAISLVYLGKQGGGTEFAKAVFDSLKSDSTRLFVSGRNSEFNDVNIVRMPGIPTGVFENVIFFIRYRKRKQLLSELSEKIGKDAVIFLMPHPLDFPLRKCLESNETFIVMHDAIKHSGDIWPMNSTIRRLGKSPGTKIFLSTTVKDLAKNFTIGSSHQLPLLMGKNSVQDSFERDIDVAFLGRHKKYKDMKFQLELIKHLKGRLKIFLSAPKAIEDRIECADNVYIQSAWLKTEEFQSILSRTKTLVLTHTEASQSGLVLDAIRFGACPIVPNISGLKEQAQHFGIPWIYSPSEVVDAGNQIKRAIARPDAVYTAREILEEDSKTWSEYFHDWI